MVGSNEKGKIPIRKILEKRDIGLYHRIETLWMEAHEVQERQRSNEHHQQGYLHCEAVENNLGKIISDDEKYNRFSPLELFLLSAAACYHDVGKSDDFDEGHATVAMRDIYSHPEKYHISNPEGKVLSNIIGSHDIDEVFSETPETCPIGGEDVRVKLLSALFRLADILHTDSSRIPNIIVGDTKKEDDKTRFRKLIQGWSFNDESQIVLRTAPEDPNDTNIIAKGVSMMQKQLECVSPILRSEGYPYEIIYSCDYRGIKWKAEIENKRNLIEMDFYTENEADIFKGRDIESKGLLKKVIGSNISLLIGNSGVGKTSLLRAGLFPKLSKMEWTCIWTRPVNPAPLDRILNDINAKLPVGYESNDIISGIKKLSEQYGTNDIIIAIDQFEDILRSPHLVKDELGKILLRIYGKSFRNVRILLSYRGDYEPEINSFLDNSGIINPSRFPLLGLDSTGAHDALRSIFETNNVGISDELIDKIIKELEKESEHGKFHPPFIQIVASSLINLAASNNGIITEELYNNKARSVETIIGEYLINRLNEFGDINSEKRINAEAILKELVRDRAKEQKGKDELLRYLNIHEDELQELLDILVDKRLIRHLGNYNYEIIHDFLASKVEEMIKDEERPLRGARDILRIKAQHYRYMPAPSLLQPNEMVLLYSMKESITPDIDEKELLMFSYLAGNGPIWWWFRDDKAVCLMIIKKALDSISSKVRGAATVALERVGRTDIVKNSNLNMREEAVRAFDKLATHSNLVPIMGMLKDTDKNKMRTMFEAFDRLVIHSDLPIIIDMLKDTDPNVRRAATEAFDRLVIHSDFPIIIDMLKDANPTLRRVATGAFERIVIHSDFPKIINLLNEANPYGRKVVTEALKKLVTRDKIESIAYMRMDYDEKTKDEVDAVYAVYKKLAAYNDFETIMDMINSQDITVRRTALAMFEKLVTHDDLTPIIYMIFKSKNLDYFDDGYFFEVYLNEMEEMKNKSKELDSRDNSRLMELEHFFKKRYMILRERDNTSKEFDSMDNSRTITLEDFSKRRYQGIFSFSERENASKEFEKFVTHDDLPKITDILKSGYYMRNRSGHVSYAAFFAFEKLATHEDLPKIIGMLRVRNWYARRAAIKTFERLVTHDDLITIIDILRDPEPDIRDVAVKAFEKLVTHDDLTVVIDMLRSPEPNIREAAMRVFEKLATYDDFTATIDMLRDYSLDVRNEASKTIIKFGNENDLQEIVKKFANGEITNAESLKCIVALDEKFYSPFENNIL